DPASGRTIDRDRRSCRNRRRIFCRSSLDGIFVRREAHRSANVYRCLHPACRSWLGGVRGSGTESYQGGSAGGVEERVGSGPPQFVAKRKKQKQRTSRAEADLRAEARATGA